MNNLCIICARGGSKGVKNKNIRTFCGKPLIAYSILQAKRSELFDYIAVSSDSEEILALAKTWGADFVVTRPQELATDTSPKVPVMRHCAQEIERLTGKSFRTIVDLDCTSPLRNVGDIVGAVTLFQESGVRNVITAAPARRSPYFNLVEVGDDGVCRLSKKLGSNIARRQDSPKCYDMNASIYVWSMEALLEASSVFLEDTRVYVMPEERSIDIDSELDFEVVEFLASKRQDEFGK